MKIGYSRRVSGRMLALSVVAAGASAAVLAMGPAGAATDVAAGTISGGGTISPGLSATPTTQSFTFSGSGSVQDPSDPAGSGTYNCSVSGNSTIAETSAHGAGTFSGSCNGPLSIAVTNGTYVRVGASVTAEGNGTASNGSSGHFEANCVFVPGQTPPNNVVSYTLTCSVALEGIV
jgi:hypothetical protein